MKKLILSIIFIFLLNVCVFAQEGRASSFKGKFAIGTNTTWIGNTR
ncbi:MAG: hypothetical protein LBC22_04065 [Endomicrobium sp.]|jgi:hypothetical protein|nr:hypothetical protein [Endomicrobium sp.]